MCRQISAAKAVTAASWPMRCLRVWVTSSRMASSRVRERVDMKCVSWGKGDGSVAGAFVTSGPACCRARRCRPLQGRTVLVRPQAKRALSFSGFALSCPTPIQVPSHRSLSGLCLPGLLPPLPHWRQQRHVPQNAVLKPASQAPQLRRLLAGARHSICDRMIAYPMDAITDHQLRNGSRLRCCALSNCDAVGGEASFPRASIALFAAGWHFNYLPALD